MLTTYHWSVLHRISRTLARGWRDEMGDTEMGLDRMEVALAIVWVAGSLAIVLLLGLAR